MAVHRSLAVPASVSNPNTSRSLMRAGGKLSTLINDATSPVTSTCVSGGALMNGSMVTMAGGCSTASTTKESNILRVTKSYNLMLSWNSILKWIWCMLSRKYNLKGSLFFQNVIYLKKTSYPLLIKVISIRMNYSCGFSSSLNLDAIFYSIINDLFYEFVIIHMINVNLSILNVIIKIISSVCLVYDHAFYITIVTIKLERMVIWKLT